MTPGGYKMQRRLLAADDRFFEMDGEGRGTNQRKFWKKVSPADRMAYAARLMVERNLTNVTEFTWHAPRVISDFVLSSKKRRRELGLPDMQPQKSRSRVDC
jgi:hypothetical protein